jgi:hypothetical protein
MGDINNTTIENFVYENGNYSFVGKLTKEDGEVKNVAGAAYETREDESKRFVGQIGITFKQLRSQLNLIMNDLNDISALSDFSQKIIAVIE